MLPPQAGFILTRTTVQPYQYRSFGVPPPDRERLLHSIQFEALHLSDAALNDRARSIAELGRRSIAPKIQICGDCQTRDDDDRSFAHGKLSIDCKSFDNNIRTRQVPVSSFRQRPLSRLSTCEPPVRSPQQTGDHSPLRHRIIAQQNPAGFALANADEHKTGAPIVLALGCFNAWLTAQAIVFLRQHAFNAAISKG
jgi:hypothetical protein